MDFQVPRQQLRYADPGRREITLLGHSMQASLVKLKEGDAIALNASHEAFVDKPRVITPQQAVGETFTFEGVPYRIVKVADPWATDPVRRGRYWRLLLVPVSD